MAEQKPVATEGMCEIELPQFPEDVREVYLLPARPPKIPGHKPKGFPKIHPVPWWRGLFWPWKRHKGCCCCCCCAQVSPQPAPPPGPVPPPLPTPPAPTVAAPTIDLRQGWLPIGGAFYLLITHRGSVCQFVLEWTAVGGVGQLTVDLEVRDPGSASFRRIATGLGPNDRHTFNGNRGASYVFRATVTDSRGQSTFDSQTVTCP